MLRAIDLLIAKLPEYHVIANRTPRKDCHFPFSKHQSAILNTILSLLHPLWTKINAAHPQRRDVSTVFLLEIYDNFQRKLCLKSFKSLAFLHFSGGITRCSIFLYCPARSAEYMANPPPGYKIKTVAFPPQVTAFFDKRLDLHRYPFLVDLQRLPPTPTPPHPTQGEAEG